MSRSPSPISHPFTIDTKERLRQRQSGIGVAREDSDDELGLEDHPWEWITEEVHLNEEEQKGETEVDGSTETGHDKVQIVEREATPPEKRRHGARKRSKVQIVGARMGQFECRIGDCVLLKAEGTSEAWVGLICNFEEDEEDDEKHANFMWFSTEKEIRNKEKKRTDFLPNELYITPSWDLNPLTAINGKAVIVSAESFESRYPNGKVPRNSKDFGKIFICRRGCNTRTATYTEPFQWEDTYNGSQESILGLIDRVQTQTKATRKKRADGRAVKRNHDEFVLADGSGLPETPRKRRKAPSASATPRSGRSAKGSKYATPTNKRVLIKKPLEITPLGTRVLSPSNLFSSPYQIARTKLHVASVPSSLPCREQEFWTVYGHLESAITDGTGSCIYVSGTPGTGKTATIREVVSQLNASVQAEELDDFVFVEINGMKVTDPHQSYSLLWEALRGERVSATHALDLLEREFGHPSPRRVPCVVLMDELDQLVTKNQSVMYNFFNWPGLAHSRLIVLAVANTMDLPERTLSNKISSRLGLTRITFPGYTHDQLMQIIQSRLEGVPETIVEPDAVQFASRKVAAVSGDARRALDICRRAVEIAEEEKPKDGEMDIDDDASMPLTPSKHLNALPPTPTKPGKLPFSQGQVQATILPPPPKSQKGTVSITTIKRAITEATSSPIQQHLRTLPLASKMFLAAVLARNRRSGISETQLGEVLEEAKRIGKMADNSALQSFMLSEALADAGVTSGKDSVVEGMVTGIRSRGRPRRETNQGQTPGVAGRMLGLGNAAVELAESGMIVLEARKGERTGKLRLNIASEEVKLALREDAESKGLGFGN